MHNLNVKEIEEHINALLERDGEDGVPGLVNRLLDTAASNAASDLHLECYRDRVHIKVRLDGMLHTVAVLGKEYQDNIIARLKIISKVPSFKSREPQDGRITLETPGGSLLQLRSSFIPTLYGEKIVVRFPDPSHLAYDIDTLGMPEEVRERLAHILLSLQGTILLTGPSSSGKTTTIYAVLKHLLKRFSDRVNIMTVEDPVEGSLDGVNQSQLDIAGGLDYTRALKAMLRQDPDVLVVGEIRDPETARICIEAGLTGHLVISTIHSGESVGVVARLLNMGIEPFLVASSLNAVIAQRIVRRVCTECGETRQATEQEKKILGVPPDDDFVTRYGRECPACAFTGFSGRTGIFELLTITESFREAILSKTTTEHLRKRAIAGGMKSLREHALETVRAGITSPSEIYQLFMTI